MREILIDLNWRLPIYCEYCQGTVWIVYSHVIWLSWRGRRGSRDTVYKDGERIVDCNGCHVCVCVCVYVCACVTTWVSSTYLCSHTLAVLCVCGESVPVTIVQHCLCRVRMNEKVKAKHNKRKEKRRTWGWSRKGKDDLYRDMLCTLSRVGRAQSVQEELNIILSYSRKRIL